MKRFIYCLAGVLSLFVLPNLSIQAHAQEATILTGIFIDDIDVSEMTGEEAKAAVKASV